MIKFICGKKGTGKTKHMIDMANTLCGESSGKVIYIDKDSARMFDLKHAIRLVATNEYNIDSSECLYGFIMGIVASDFDIHTVFIDSFLKIAGKDKTPEEINDLVLKLDDLSRLHNVRFVISLSADLSDLPDYVKERTI